jgi:hypothetical protein
MTISNNSSPNSNSIESLLQGLEQADDSYPREETIHDVMEGQSPGQDAETKGKRAAKKEQQRLDNLKSMQGKPMSQDDVAHRGGNNKERRDQNEMAEIRAKNKDKKKKDLKFVSNPNKCYEWGIKELARLHLHELLINQDSKIPGKIEISYEGSVKPQFEYGFNPRGGYKLFKPVTATGQKIQGQDFITYLDERMDDGEGYNFDYKVEWLEFLSGATKDGKLGRIIKSKGLGHQRCKSLTGNLDAHKVIPPYSWFCERIHKIDVANELLSLWDKAEREALMIMIGRACAGASYEKASNIDEKDPTDAINKTTRTLEEFQDEVTGEYVIGGLEHTSRSIPVLCGAAGVGKSHFMDALRRAFNNLGFSNAVVPLSGNQFGFGAFESTDVVFSDDTSRKDFANIYGSSQIKTAASSGTIPLENKGVDVRPARSTAAIFIATNDIWIPNPDEGCSSRFEFLQVRGKTKLNKVYNGLTYESHLKQLAKKHDTNVDVLFMYLLRICLDKFIETTGYVYNKETRKFDKVAPSTLEKRLNKLREKFVFQGKVDAEKLLVEACVKVQAMNTLLKDLGLLTHYKDKLNPNPRAEDNHTIAVGHVLQLAETLINLKKRCSSMKQPNSDDFLPHIVNDKSAVNYYDTLQNIINWILPSSKFDHGTVINFYNGVKTDISNSGAKIDKYKLWKDHIKNIGTFYTRCSDRLDAYKNKWDTAITNKDAYENELKDILRNSRITVNAVAVLAKAVTVFQVLDTVLSARELADMELERQVKANKKREKLIIEKNKRAYSQQDNVKDYEEEFPEEFINIDGDLTAVIAEIRDYTPEEIENFKTNTTVSNNETSSKSTGKSKGFAMKNKTAQSPVEGF